MAHHIGNEHTSRFWSEHQNELIRRVCDMYPPTTSHRCVSSHNRQVSRSTAQCENSSVVSRRWGFIGCNVNPDPTGGFWTGPPLSDRYWWPLWEKMCELDVPGMIHVSASCNENFLSDRLALSGRRHHSIRAGP